MSMRLLRLLIEVILVATAANALAQDEGITLVRPRPLAEALRSHGVTDLSEKSLLAALKNSDPSVRSLAANKLAEDGYADAGPLIETALTNEKNLNTQVNLAEALWVLHDPKGLKQLESMCTDPSTPASGLISALQALQNTQSPMGACAGTVLSSIDKEKDTGLRVMLASRLPPMYSDASPDQARRIFSTLKNLLLDKRQPSVLRQVSSQSLAQIGVPESAEVIRNAIAQEADSNLRSSFQRDLDALEKRP